MKIRESAARSATVPADPWPLLGRADTRPMEVVVRTRGDDAGALAEALHAALPTSHTALRSPPRVATAVDIDPRPTLDQRRRLLAVHDSVPATGLASLTPCIEHIMRRPGESARVHAILKRALQPGSITTTVCVSEFTPHVEARAIEDILRATPYLAWGDIDLRVKSEGEALVLDTSRPTSTRGERAARLMERFGLGGERYVTTRRWLAASGDPSLRPEGFLPCQLISAAVAFARIESQATGPSDLVRTLRSQAASREAGTLRYNAALAQIATAHGLSLLAPEPQPTKQLVDAAAVRALQQWPSLADARASKKR